MGAKVVFIHQSAKHFIRILTTSYCPVLILKGQLFRLVQLNIVSLQKIGCTSAIRTPIIYK